MYKKNRHIHFIGIGGIGMSAIATVLKQQGYKISGCDSCLEQKSIKKLTKLECTIACPNNSPLCHDDSIDVIVYSAAIKQNNPELVAARQKGIPVISRAEMLAHIMRTHESIAVAGSHGKTTTSSLISHVLLEAQLDPTIIIGGHLQSIDNNGQLGTNNLLVAEADESDRSLTTLPASIGIITNISLEHLDTYKDIEDIKQTFAQFLSNLPFYGKAILCIDDANTADLFANLPQEIQQKVTTYGFSSQAEFQITEHFLGADKSTASILYKNSDMGKFTISMPGKCNLLNAAATIAVAHELGIDFSTTAQALACFAGVDRRFTFKGTYKGAELFDDYGHHPVEIKNILEVARRRAKKRLIVLFQPHRFSRTKELWHDFVAAFSNAEIDHLIITDIYPASENPIAGITSESLTNSIKDTGSARNVHYAPEDRSFNLIQSQLDEIVDADDLVLFLGAGRINLLAKKLI